MAVAKSYETMEIQGEPYARDGKKYVRVIGPCKRCGGSGHYSFNSIDGTTCFSCHGSGKEILEVRWYTDAQRASMDKAAEKRAAAKVVKDEERRVKFAARNAFGFGDAGYITLIQGDNETIKEWRTELPEHTVWYNELFGWFIPAGREPENIPDEFCLHVLKWKQVRDEEDKEDLQIRDKEEVRKLVHTMLYGESKSQYQGNKDEWLEHDVTIKRNIAISSSYGDSHMHIMEDADGNVYVWTTASKNLEEGKTIHLRMKVKDHKEYQGVKQTIVYYCKVK
jgi:hypothetical protein